MPKADITPGGFSEAVATYHDRLAAPLAECPTVIYECWLIYKLCAGFLMSRWEQLAPDIVAAV